MVEQLKLTHNLPRSMTTFIGRDRDLAAIGALLNDPNCRLLTLVGPGGIGKTRLALEVAQQADFSDGIYFVPLQPLGDSESIVTAIIDALPLQLTDQTEPSHLLLTYLRDRHLLLVLDNFEHLLNGVEIIIHILNNTNRVQLLITSRERLNLQSEQVWTLQGLDVPEEGMDSSILTSAAQLFDERARRVQPDFLLQDHWTAVVDICRVVEGMPLALELAASWVHVLPCETIADEIRRNVDILTSGQHDLHERHQSMRAVFDHSWKLLTEAERAAFCRLSVFRGGFTAEAFQQVARTSLPTLASLIDKSLLRLNDNVRYDMHELLRQYADEQLARDDVEVHQAQLAHAEYYTNFLHRREQEIHSRRQHEVIKEIESELDNIRVAWRCVVQEADLTAIQAGVAAYCDLCDILGHYREALDAITFAIKGLEALETSEERDFTLAILKNYEGSLLIRFGRFDEMRTAIQMSIQLYRNLDRQPPPGWATEPLMYLGMLASTIGNYSEAVAYCEAALDRVDPQNNTLNFVPTLYVLAIATYALGQYETASRYAQHAFEISKEMGDDWFVAYILVIRGNIARAVEDYDRAWGYYQTSYNLKKVFNDLGGMAFALNCMARIAWLRGEYRDSERLYKQGLEHYRDVSDLGGLATSLFGLGDAAQAMGDYSAGRRYFQQSLKIAVDIHWLPLILEIVTGIADLLLETNEPEQAVQLLTLSVDHPANEPTTRRRAKRLFEQARGLLTEDGFDAARRHGESIGIDKLLQSMLEHLRHQPDNLQPYPHLPANQELIDPLTRREQEVLQLLVAGLTNQQIANELFVSVGTIKKHNSNIFSKLSVTTRMQAMVRARDLNLVK